MGDRRKILRIHAFFAFKKTLKEERNKNIEEANYFYFSKQSEIISKNVIINEDWATTKGELRASTCQNPALKLYLI